MKNFRTKPLIILWLCSLLISLHACDDVDDLQRDVDRLKPSITQIESYLKQLQASANLLKSLQSGTKIVGVTLVTDNETGKKHYEVELSDGTTALLQACKESGNELQNSVFSDVKYDAASGIVTVTLHQDGSSLSFPVIGDFFLKVKDAEGELSFTPNQTRIFEVEQSQVNEAMIQAPSSWLVKLTDTRLSVTAPFEQAAGLAEEIKIVITSPQGYIRIVPLSAKVVLDGMSQTYQEFIDGSENNVLLDFSYAGYNHGETAPADVYSLGYKVYDVTKYGAVPDDGISDREAIYKALVAAGATQSVNGNNTRFTAKGNKLNAIIYFPKGTFDIQATEAEVNKCIHLTMGHFVIKGAGRDKTTLKMSVQNEPARPNEMWSCPTVIEIKNYQATSELTSVTEDAAKGAFKVKVASTAGIAKGDWVMLYLKNNDPECVAQELAPHAASDLASTAAIIQTGVDVNDYHQVKSISGNEITFYEPLMHAVEARWNWKIHKFPHFEEVGVEDICFEGKAKEDFGHHASAYDDGGFKLIDYGRLTNSWMRRVSFKSVSECASMVGSANCSVYDVEISGNRGHSAVRSQGSSRIFIGKVYDHSDGKELLNPGGWQLGGYMTNAGQYHACGVSKQSLGAVIWRVKWGDDACFESHATQPRATLIDACQGAFIMWRQGGDMDQLPNHLNDLTIWNMNVTRTKAADNNPFIWWQKGAGEWWKNLPPTIVGMHGVPVTFDESSEQVKRIESPGTEVYPQSLYEAQLQRRLGYLPAWVSALK